MRVDRAILLSVLCGLFLGISCIFPDTGYGVLLGASSVLIFWYLLHLKRPALFYLTGVVFHFTSMWWLGGTMERFGGFHWSLACFLLVLYCLLSSLQFFFSAWFAPRISGGRYLPFSFIFSWMLFEIFFPRLFPWGLGDFFISVHSLSSYAEIVGARGLSFIVLVGTYVLYSMLCAVFGKGAGGRSISYVSLSVASLLALFVCGFYLDRAALARELSAPRVSALVVQGNLDIHEKGKKAFLEANLKTYQELSVQALSATEEIDFVIWPETVMNRWTPITYKNYPEPELDPFPELEIPLLYGALAYYLEQGKSSSEADTFNAAILRDESGGISSYYAKRILMPFGEYVPFGDTFPWIRSLVPLQGEFTKGTVESPLEIRTKDRVIRAGVLICYEDLVSEISRSYARRDAQVLINLTNDAWYGDSPAPYQHDLLARFRAIETRRALIRSTNTGFTTLVSSRGEIVNSLPLFTEAYEVFSVPLLEGETLYSACGDYPLYGFLFVLGGCLIWIRMRRRWLSPQ